jgi:hypothetical protein
VIDNVRPSIRCILLPFWCEPSVISEDSSQERVPSSAAGGRQFLDQSPDPGLGLEHLSA